jgi:hypothetical protein
MSWQPIDFQGITSLDTPTVDLLHQYLEEKESNLANAILHAIPPDLGSPSLPYSTSFKLSEAVEAFSKKCSQSLDALERSDSSFDWEQPIKEINKALWEYVEVLEGSSTELFQQLELIGLEQWHARLPNVVGTIKELLLHKLEEVLWSVRRLEDHLWKYRINCEMHFKRSVTFLKLSRYWTSLLDRKIIPQIEKTEAFLRLQYNRFIKRYGGYVELQQKVEQLEKFSEFPVLPTLDRDTQNHFKKLYQLVKLWDLNRTEKSIPSREIVLALRHALSIQKASSLFKDYYEAVKSHLFRQSRFFKRKGEELLSDTSVKMAHQLEVDQSQLEIRTLGATIEHYRDFLLRADPDPYVRSRLGFSERIVGPEPAQTKPLLDLGYDVETINDLCIRLKKALDMEPSELKQEAIIDVDHAIQEALHEMGQPLATHRMMRSKVETVLENLEKLKEWESFSSDVVDYVGTTFSKLLRKDWKFQVVHEFNLFQELYNIHHGLVKPIEDRAHLTRMSKLTKLLNEIQQWVEKHRTQNHFHDIELDLNDIKGYLQDFLAYVQRCCQDKNLSSEQAKTLKAELSQQLLDYRYLFSTFFYQLRQNEQEGQLIRRQCLFVDQYFDSVEQKLLDLDIRDFSNQDSEQEN